MRIALVQSAPKLGDFAHNCVSVERLLQPLLRPQAPRIDLLVLPELALTGYAFATRQAILPHCERLQCEGRELSWEQHAKSLHFARQTSRRLRGAPVLIGVPERTASAIRTPDAEEDVLYNSAALVRGGELLHVYRKHHLFTTDEAWATEGEYFGQLQHADVLDGRKIALGICMDLNPRKFEAPWDAFEFGKHCLAVDAEVVIVPMAWLRSESPDGGGADALETLRYWLMRLSPLLEDAGDSDTKSRIFVACNRTGMEGETTYAGRSAVCRIRGGKVDLFGHLGEEEGLLVVDV